MTMSETTVGLSDNNLFGNLIANTRPSANNPGSQTLNINSIQSDTTAGDVQDIENIDDIPFQEILGLHICNLNSHDTPNSPVPNTPAVELTNIELAQESVTETNPSVLSEQKSDTIQPADLLQKTFIPYPESTMQGIGNNLSPNRDKTAGSANLNIYNSFADVNNGHPSISPFVPLSQRESKWGFEERKGINVILDRHLVETHNPGSIFSLEKSNVNAVDKMDKPFIQDMDVGNTLSKTDPPKLNLPNSDIYEITESPKQDIASISQTNEKWNLFGNHTQKQNTSDTVSFNAHTHKSNNGTPFSLDSQTTASNAQSNVPDFQQNTKASPHSGTPLSSSAADAKTVNHMFYSNDVPGVEHAQENIMEQIFQKIRITTHGDRSEIKLSLNPPELGNIKIHFMEEHDEIEAKIYVENAEVKAAIEKNAHHLKESVAANGIEIHKLEVYIQNDDANKQKLTEYFDAYNPHHHNQTHSQKGYDEDQILNEEDITGNLQTKNSTNASNLMVDYII